MIQVTLICTLRSALLLAGTILLTLPGTCQLRWDGEGGDGRWDNASNWAGDQLPGPASVVVLDNSLLAGDYMVSLPPGNISTELTVLRIAPGSGNSIELLLPRENTAIPGLRLTGSDDALILENGSRFSNASGASSGEPLQIAGTLYIANGARYLHQTARGNATLVDHLSAAPGTEYGIFEFDVPGSAGYTVSLTGNSFGTLAFRTSGTKSYSGSGASALHIRGHLDIGAGVTLTSTMTADILLDGDLLVNGGLTLQPATSGSAMRSLQLRSNRGIISGNGRISLQGFFREIRLVTGASYTLQRNLNLPLSQHQLLLEPAASLVAGTYEITGAGRFQMSGQSLLSTSHPMGFHHGGNQGTIQTAVRLISNEADLSFTGSTNQITGDGFPGTIGSLRVHKLQGLLELSQSLNVNGTLWLDQGIIESSEAAMLGFRGDAVQSPVNAYGQTNAGWEKSYVSGPLRWQASQPGPVILPSGITEKFAPILLDPEAADGSWYTVRYHAEARTPIVQPITPLQKVSMLEYWHVRTDAPVPGGPLRVGLSWRPASGAGETDEARAELRVAGMRADGTGWESLDNNPRVRYQDSLGWIETTVATAQASAYTLGSTGNLNILPLSFIDIGARISDGRTIIWFRTEGTGQCPPLQLEQSLDGRQFKPSGTLRTGLQFGTSYQLTDSLPAPGWSYYRIQPQASGIAGKPSRVVSVFHQTRSPLRIYPNPVQRQLTIEYSGLSSEIPAQVVHTDGRVLFSFVLRDKIQSADIGHLPAGRYFLWLKRPEGHQVIPFLKE